MSRAVYLHIGAPKTGTTYLQDRLAVNARSLAANGVHFPARNPMTSPALSQFRAALDLLDQDWGGPAGHAEGYWEAMTRKARRLSGSVIISHEILAPATPSQVAKAVASFGRAEVHVVYSARDMARQLPAAWQESIKQGRRWSYRSFLDRVTTQRPWFARAFDLPGVLATWGEVVPTERLHVVAVPQTSGPELWQRFCAVFEIDPDWAPRESEAVNASLGVAETAMLRRLNRRMRRDARREARFDELMREMLAQDRLVRRQSAPLLVPPRLDPWVEEEAQRWIDYLTASGVHVVGDVEDLRPRPRDPDVAWVNPDKIGPKPQLRAALDALSAMTLEATRREDPDGKIVAKVRSRVRELRDD
ncbi:hypothetical protein [Nocardioides sp. R-C-SC26]|uniref:hypothetical protein n=1 Tax=Nocardioides sp. R-C-SC26 TaxID=2870414 RepID=UPI001E4E2F6E|nr:hypothetical protein [Nocardioides sp. R-C-SC26]